MPPKMGYQKGTEEFEAMVDSWRLVDRYGISFAEAYNLTSMEIAAAYEASRRIELDRENAEKASKKK